MSSQQSIHEPLEDVSFNHSSEGVLDWFDAADAQGNIVVRTMGSSFPKRPGAVTPWLKKALSFCQQPFFVMPLLANNFRLPCELVKEKTATDPMWTVVHVKIPLAAFFNLPNENPLQELAQLRAFFEWAQTKSGSLGFSFFESPRLQWYRGGSASGTEYGLEWAGLNRCLTGTKEEVEATSKAWADELATWREQPWFEAWYSRNIAGMKKLRLGPHCWASMGFFRDSYRLFNEQRAAGIIIDKPKQASAKPSR